MEYVFPPKSLLETRSKDLEEDKHYSLSRLIYYKDFNDYKMTFPVGMDEFNEQFYVDLLTKSGVLISGETGSGKSMMLNTIIISLLLKNTPQEVQFIFIDPRYVEFNKYLGIPHLVAPIIFNPDKSINSLKKLLNILEKRRELFLKDGVSNIAMYNEKKEQKIPHMVMVIDEASELFTYEEFNDVLGKILLDGCKYGIHIILSTSSRFKNNMDKKTIELFDCLLTFDLASLEQSNYINIKKSHLLGKDGDALMKCPNDDIIHIQTPYVSNADIDSIIEFIISHT